MIFLLQDDKKFYQLELVNRETNFNKVFNASPNVGVINPLIKVGPLFLSIFFVANLGIVISLSSYFSPQHNWYSVHLISALRLKYVSHSVARYNLCPADSYCGPTLLVCFSL